MIMIPPPAASRGAAAQPGCLDGARPRWWRLRGPSGLGFWGGVLAAALVTAAIGALIEVLVLRRDWVLQTLQRVRKCRRPVLAPTRLQRPERR